MKRITMLLGAGILILSSMVYAAVPQLINFQGVLKDANGNPAANGNYSIKFDIFDAVGPGGGCLWTETQSVAVQNGQFSVLLGSVNAAGIPDTAFNGPDRWLAITVGNDPEMTPRQRLGSVGYSYRVGTVDGATGGIIYGNTSIQSDAPATGAMDAKRLVLNQLDPSSATLLIKGSSGQTANLMEIKNSLGTPLVSVDANGDMDGLGSTWENVQAIDINCDGALNVNGPVAIQSDAGQTSNFTEWRRALPGGGFDTAVVVDANGHVGIGTGSPNSPLQVNGAFSKAIKKFNNCSVTLDETHHVVLMPATQEGCHVYLPTAVGISGREYTIKAWAIEIGGTLVIHPIAGQTIDGNSGYSLNMLTYSWVTIISDGENWWIIGEG